MLVAASIFSLVLLVVSNLAVLCGKNPAFTILVFGGVGLAAPAVMGFIPTLLIPQAVLLLMAYSVWRSGQFAARGFFFLSAVATLLPFAVVAGWHYLELEQRRSRYPYESVEERLSSARTAETGALSYDARTRLDELETKLEWGHHLPWSRANMLKQLHEHAVVTFINSPGFGVARMLAYPSADRLAMPHREPTPRQPGFEDAPSWSPGLIPEHEPLPWTDLLKLHDGGVADFLDPDTFGYVKDRRHVAGFVPHQFSQVPGPAERWAVERLDLVSLLLHEEPVAYVSARLPKMDELREVPTRALDEFEAAALATLRGGEDQVVRATDAGVRMLGSLRAVKQCLSCHDAARGDLLGAFSYTLRPARSATAPR